jgi:hypothetical protein
MGAHPDEAARLAQSILNQIQNDAGAEEVQRACVQIFVWLYLWHNHPGSEFVYSLCTDVRGKHKLLNGMLFMCGEP